MDFDAWWLLALPLFFVAGWVAARIDIKQLVSESKRLPNSYFRGLNFLLNEQPDKAIEAFVEVVKVEPGTVELHFALGSLFRRRGEVERAIRMHQIVLERSDLAEEQRLQALFELAQDYLKAGLLDRAEQTFSRLRGTAWEQRGLRFLLGIYEQEKDWAKAIETSREMDAITGESSAREIAQFWCELASDALLHSRHDEARRHLESAFAVNRKCPRAVMLTGDLELAQDRVDEAIAAWQRMEQVAPDYLALLPERLFGAWRRAGREADGLQLMHGYLARYPSLDLLTAVFDAVRAVDGDDAAADLLRDELKRTPSLLALVRLIDLQITQAPPERRQELELMRDLIQQHTRTAGQYRCGQCGFRARQFYWHCPACHGWETYAPRRTEEREFQ